MHKRPHPKKNWRLNAVSRLCGMYICIATTQPTQMDPQLHSKDVDCSSAAAAMKFAGCTTGCTCSSTAPCQPQRTATAWQPKKLLARQHWQLLNAETSKHICNLWRQPTSLQQNTTARTVTTHKDLAVSTFHAAHAGMPQHTCVRSVRL